MARKPETRCSTSDTRASSTAAPFAHGATYLLQHRSRWTRGLLGSSRDASITEDERPRSAVGLLYIGARGLYCPLSDGWTSR